jgi:uncharacterized membrane protein YqjE
MADPATRSRNPAGHAGLLDNLVALLGALAVYFESRAALFATESKTAAVRVLVIALCFVQALLFFGCGYIFLIAAAVVGIAHVLNISWTIIALIAAVLHFLLAAVLVFIAQTKMRRPLYRATIEEIKKDCEWLANLDKTTLS